MLIKSISISLLLGLLLVGVGRAQNEATLAEEYYKAGEFEKAANEYGKLLKADVSWPRLVRYVNSLQRSNKTEEAAQYLRKQLSLIHI